jgi:hypothetical protein
VATFDLSILNRRGLGKRVLALLQSKHALPEEGVIAGQSVASAIDELYKLTPPVYNDIDVFLSAPQWQSQTGEDVVNYRAGFRSRILGTVAYKAEKIEVMPAEYSRVFLISDRHLYTVVKARTDGLINRVWVSWSLYELNRERNGPRAAAGVAAERAITLIAGFDLNCCAGETTKPTSNLCAGWYSPTSLTSGFGMNASILLSRGGSSSPRRP